MTVCDFDLTSEVALLRDIVSHELAVTDERMGQISAMVQFYHYPNFPHWLLLELKAELKWLKRFARDLRAPIFALFEDEQR